MRTLYVFLALYLLAAPARAALPVADTARPARQRPVQYLSLTLVRAGTVLRGPRVVFSRQLDGRHELGIGLEWLSQRARHMPEDGQCSGCRHGDPLDILFGGTLSYGYIIHPFSAKPRFQLALRGGLLIGRSVVRYGFEKTPQSTPDAIYYTWTTNDFRFAAGLLLHPTLDLPLPELAGVSVGPYVVLNRLFPAAGISLDVLFGNLW